MKKSLTFKSEAEEADYWYAHRREVEADLRKAKNTLTPAEIVAREQTRPVNIRMAVGDIERAKQLAIAKGIGYQTLIRMLLHESLAKENA